MVGLVHRFIGANGKIFENIGDAQLNEKLVTTKEQINRLQKELKELEESCPHTQRQFKRKEIRQGKMIREREFPSGADWHEQLEVSIELCDCCGKELTVYPDGSYTTW